jgi:hypothetical protein
MRRVRAWAEFASDPTTHVQLELAEGDVIHVLHEANQDGWGYGINDAGREGYFPMTHVEDLPPPPPTSSHVPLHAAAASGAPGAVGGCWPAPTPHHAHTAAGTVMETKVMETKGICSLCGNTVFGHQERGKDQKGSYFPCLPVVPRT